MPTRLALHDRTTFDVSDAVHDAYAGLGAETEAGTEVVSDRIAGLEVGARRRAVQAARESKTPSVVVRQTFAIPRWLLFGVSEPRQSMGGGSDVSPLLCLFGEETGRAATI
jgi:hypothetical protein